MRLRSLLIVLSAALALGLLAGCGNKASTADSGTDVDQLLKDTFSGNKDIKSGKLDISLTGAAGGQDFAAKLSGPFQSTGTGKVPKLDIDASLEGSGQNLQAGITSTGDQAFVSYGGTAYEVAGPLFQQFKAQYEQQANQNKDAQSLATLGIDPSKWLRNARNAGTAKVGDTDTVKITGDVDVPTMLDDVNRALAKLRSISGVGGAGIPDQLSQQDKQQAADAIKQLGVEIYTGSEDKILRRLVVAMKLAVPNGGSTQSADVKFDMQFLDLNEDQDIKAPANPRPFDELTSKLQGLGLGGLGGVSGGSSGSGSGSSQKSLEKYSKCIQDAGSDQGKIRKCADLLTP
jgi:hypothetical protein